MEAYFHAFVTLELDGCKWSVSGLRRFTMKRKLQVTTGVDPIAGPDATRKRVFLPPVTLRVNRRGISPTEFVSPLCVGRLRF
jgi:hypothetical protein